MKKLKDFMFLLVWFLLLSLILSSCEKVGAMIGGKTKDGEVKVTNYSPYKEDDPVNIKLILMSEKRNGSFTILGDEKVKRNKSITFTDVPSEVLWNLPH